MPSTPTRLLPLLLALACAGLPAVAPAAGAQLEGSLTYDLESLEELGIEGQVTASGELAAELRNRTDRDDDGEVGVLEAAGAETVLADDLEGPTNATRVDGRASTVEDADVDLEGLAGPTDSRAPIDVDLELEVRVQPGAGPTHRLALSDPLEAVDGPARLGLDLHAPEGYRIVETEGLEPVLGCRARLDPGPIEATATLEAREGACQDPIPSAGPAAVGLSLAAGALAALTRRRELAR